MRARKRLFDIAFSILALIACAPLFLFISLAVLLSDGGPVFFRQERVGKHGLPFRIWKFRSMVPGASALGPNLTVGGDPRVTPVGRLLRYSKLDELPQLINVLMGQMSFVGPRPEVAEYVALYDPRQRAVLELIPGITDPASVTYSDEERVLADSPEPKRLYIERIMPDKIRLNLEYAAEATLWTDLGVIGMTLTRVLGYRVRV